MNLMMNQSVHIAWIPIFSYRIGQESCKMSTFILFATIVLIEKSLLRPIFDNISKRALTLSDDAGEGFIKSRYSDFVYSWQFSPQYQISQIWIFSPTATFTAKGHSSKYKLAAQLFKKRLTPLTKRFWTLSSFMFGSCRISILPYRNHTIH